MTFDDLCALLKPYGVEYQSIVVGSGERSTTMRYFERKWDGRTIQVSVQLHSLASPSERFVAWLCERLQLDREAVMRRSWH